MNKTTNCFNSKHKLLILRVLSSFPSYNFSHKKRRRKFESFYQPGYFQKTYPRLIKAYDLLSSLLLMIWEALIAQLKSCLLDCSD